MTAKQIKTRIEKAGFSTENLTIARDEIEVAVDYREFDYYGEVNERKTKALAKKIKSIFPEISYTSGTQYGAIRMLMNFTKCPLVSQNID